MGYLEDLKAKAALLENSIEDKNLELNLLQNEMQDNLRPNILLLQLVQFVLQMIMELNEYEQKNKLTARMKASKERLIKMLEVTTELSGIGDKMQSFKLFNRELFTRNQLLRIENMELKQQLKNIEDAANF